MLSAQQDSTTSFGRNAQVRCTAREPLVRMDCGRRYAAAMLRRARPVNKQYEQGHFVMCSVTWCARAPASEWEALARIIGFEVGIVWLQHGAVPVASALHLLRPSTTAELLPSQVLIRNMRRPVRTTPRTKEQGVIDAREPTAPSQGQQPPITTLHASPDCDEDVENDDSQPEMDSLSQFTDGSPIGRAQTARGTRANREACASRWWAHACR